MNKGRKMGSVVEKEGEEGLKKGGREVYLRRREIR